MAERALGLPSLSGRWRGRLHAARVIQRRVSLTTFQGLGIYVTLASALIVAALLLHNQLRFAGQNLILVTRQPLFLPLVVTTGITSFYLAMTAALIAARERDHGTLELLLYGPVDEAAYLLGLFLAQLKAYLGVLLLLVVWSVLASWLLNLHFEWQLVALLVFTLATAAAVIGVALLVAAWSGGTRSALFYFILIFLLFATFQVADEVVGTLAIESGGGRNDQLLLIRNALAALRGPVAWLSPYAHVRPVLEALVAGKPGEVTAHLGVTLLQTVVALGTGIMGLRRRGVRS